MKRLLLSAGALLGLYKADAQVIGSNDSSQVTLAMQIARQRHLATAPESRLINGVAYANNRPSYVTGQPFLGGSAPQPSTLDYDGQHFAGVQLLYEQVLDQVLLYGSVQAAKPVQLQLPADFFQEQALGQTAGAVVPARSVPVVPLVSGARGGVGVRHWAGASGRYW